jgi:hypothetical protein
LITLDTQIFETPVSAATSKIAAMPHFPSTLRQIPADLALTLLDRLSRKKYGHTVIGIKNSMAFSREM